jgi:hypothetical protein
MAKFFDRSAHSWSKMPENADAALQWMGDVSV